MLGVHFPSTDIDAICLFPGHVSKDDFFQDFIKTIENRPGFTNVYCIKQARVPIVKLEVHGI
jgi:poly(A) polymerase